MLYNPRWQKKTDVFSLESLIEWLKGEDPNTRYNYWDNQRCLICKYLDAMGIEYQCAGAADFAVPNKLSRQKLEGRWDLVTPAHPWTYGGALERALAEVTKAAKKVKN